ncbi:bifunctional methylenetetrahydrofolate dehydrogenase/methenyltetrahydrofolate cyclohydrolase FolD [Ectothiorhodospiraceae bacterium BW-2]|nr:bifunctional methylenetetrahydrofolate dehydrogenase/methenyltetrahydrofolate cyclohydrolase FolD [Ectothiorhodospiraceae bacterium BW-2]
MSAKIIDGKAVAAQLRYQLQQQLSHHRQQGSAPPGLAVILIGDDAASTLYVANKRKACAEIGIHSIAHDLPNSTTESELLHLIDTLNADSSIHGILVQFPLPSHINSATIIERIKPQKDVDGFHPYNIGRLAVRMPTLRSCTPYGVMKLLQSIETPFKGQDAVVIGASNHVGRPMVLELMLAGATVTCCHRFSRDSSDHIRRADIVIAAVGKAGLVKGAWIKPGSTVIDIGINRLESGQLVGDVEFDAAAERAGWITPVPGGVGPMTVATLMENTLKAALIQQQVQP